MRRFISAFLILVILGTGLTFTAASAIDGSVAETATAFMDITFECGCRRTGAGAMIAVNGLVTAAHNLVCSAHGKKNKSIDFYFGYKGRKKAFYKYTGRFHYTYYENFSGGFRSEDDIGYVVFPSDVGKKTGWFASSPASDDDLKWEYTHVLGIQNDAVTEDWEQIEVYSSKEFTWPISPGFKNTMEGGPAFWSFEEDDYPTVVGVYTSHSDSKGFARRLTSNIYADMRADGVKFN